MRGRRGLHNGALARPAAIARPAGDQHTEGCGYHIEALGNILANLVQGAATAGAGLILNINGLLDPLEMGWQGSTIDLARAAYCSTARLVAGLFGLGQRCLDIFKGQFELVRIKLLGSAAKPVALEGIDDRLQTFRPGLEMLECFELASLLKDERAQRFNVIRQVSIH